MFTAAEKHKSQNYQRSLWSFIILNYQACATKQIHANFDESNKTLLSKMSQKIPTVRVT